MLGVPGAARQVHCKFSARLRVVRLRMEIAPVRFGADGFLVACSIARSDRAPLVFRVCAPPPEASDHPGERGSAGADRAGDPNPQALTSLAAREAPSACAAARAMAQAIQRR